MTETIKAIRAKVLYKPPIGDIDVYGLDGWLTPLPSRLNDGEGAYLERDDGLMIIPLAYKHSHPFRALASLGIDISEVEGEAAYTCPIMKQGYCAFVPVAIMTRDLERYLSRGEWRPWVPGMVRDQDFVTDNLWFDGLSIFETLIIGSGYTDFILPSDGGNKVVLNALQLDNGDIVLVWHYEWFNK